MIRQFKRKVLAADIESYGVVSAHDMLRMPEDVWGLIRDKITDKRNGRDGLKAKCCQCGSPVYIAVRKNGGIKAPLFVHYKGGDPNCPWHDNGGVHPSKLRAQQYGGLQESKLHKHLCELVGELAALDPRLKYSKVEKYLPPINNDFGRYPDVCIEMDGVGKYVFEIQLSKTFQTEISQRCKHYEYENIPLIWLLWGVGTLEDMDQSFVDVVRRHYNNAFLIDMESINESRRQEKLILSCYLKSDDGFDGPYFVGLDDLTIPKSKVPYYEDRISSSILSEAKKNRKMWFDLIDKWDHYNPFYGLNRNQCLLVAAAFSIAANANGKNVNYASNHNSVKAMLNTYLKHGHFSKYSDLIYLLIKNTNSSKIFCESVKRHLVKYRAEDQVCEDSIEWKLLRDILPEALDPLVRKTLIDLDALPSWAMPLKSNE